VKKWAVYIIQSCTTGKLYTGMSNDVLKRLATHNAGRGARYTKTGRPWRLAYVEIVATKSDALKRECQIKRLTRARKLRLAQALGSGLAAPLQAAAQDS
jgi:putative endonuclease